MAEQNLTARLDLTVQTGVTWSRTLIWTRADGSRRSLAGLAARMEVRAKKGGPVLLSLSSEVGGGIGLEQATVDGDAAGVITLTIPGPVSAPLTQSGVPYDLKLVTLATEDGEPSYRPIEGLVYLDVGVTQ
jgi:hypothetical protein